MRVRIRQSGVRELQNGLSDGLEAVAERLLPAAMDRAPVDEGDTKGSLHTETSHSREWPKPVVFVSTATGDGFFVHEGTVDTPPHPFLSEALSAIASDIPNIMRRESNGGRGFLK